VAGVSEPRDEAGGGAEMPWNDKAKRRAYHRQYIRSLRERALKLLGGRCVRCRSGEDLELHHRWYSPESAVDNQQYRRIREALENPDQFDLLCRNCHLSAHKEQVERTGRVDPRVHMDLLALSALARQNRGRNLFWR